MHAWASDASGFPEGCDAVRAAPDSLKVIFENALQPIESVENNRKPGDLRLVRVEIEVGT
jgi:hypothetical protein